MKFWTKKKRKHTSAQQIITPNGYTAISDSTEDDIFIVGYPKSGNTWFQNLVAGVVYGVIPDYAPPALASRMLVPDVQFEKFYMRFSTPTFFKSHLLPKRQYKKVVYLVRDGRDAMTSYYHYLLAMQEKVDFLEMIRTGSHTPCKWHEHVEAWLSNPHASQMIVIKYENLIKDAVSEMKRFCEFAEIEREESHISMITKSTSFKNLQNRERRVGRCAENPKWEKGKMFFRRGEIGAFRDEMSESVLKCFMEQAAPTLEKIGYVI